MTECLGTPAVIGSRDVVRTAAWQQAHLFIGASGTGTAGKFGRIGAIGITHLVGFAGSA